MSADLASKSEHLVQREVLRTIGPIDDVLVCVNAVGQGYTGNVLYALQAALRPFGPAVVAAAAAVLQRHRIVWGLGVGSPDLVLSVAGRAAGIELKRPVGGVVSDDQKRWHSAARRRGVAVGLATSAEEAVDFVNRVRRGGVE